MEAKQVNADVIRALQHFLNAANAGQIVGFIAVGIGPGGETLNSMAMPPNPQALHIALGAIEVGKDNLKDAIKQMQQPGNVSRILRPATPILS